LSDSVVDLNGVTVTDLTQLITTGTVDPIVLDVGAPGISFTEVGNGVQFDINGDGIVDQVAWTAAGDGFLALDVNGSGSIDSGAELFSPYFAGGSYASGMAALATLDSNSDGVVDAADAGFGSLQLWQDVNNDGVSGAGELTRVADRGISGINVNAAPSATASINGQHVLAEGTFTNSNGSHGSLVEVALDTAPGGGPLPAVAEPPRTDAPAGPVLDAPPPAAAPPTALDMSAAIELAPAGPTGSSTPLTLNALPIEPSIVAPATPATAPVAADPSLATPGDPLADPSLVTPSDPLAAIGDPIVFPPVGADPIIVPSTTAPAPPASATTENVLSGADPADQTLAGAVGHDRFVFAGHVGHDAVEAFTVGEDKFEIRFFADLDTLLAHAAEVGSDTVITVDAANTITLKNVSLAQLAQADLIFA
jgi:hypothetical protein